MYKYIIVLFLILFHIQDVAFASCWSDCDDKFDEWYQEPDRVRCKGECEVENVVENSGYQTNKFDLQNEVEGGGWTVAWAEDISETDALKGVVAAGVSIYSSNPEVFMQWIKNLIDRTVDSLYANMQKEYSEKAVELASEVIISAIQGKTAKEISASMDTVDFKAGAIKYSGRNYIGDTTISRTWGLKPYVAFRIRSSSARGQHTVITESRDSKNMAGQSDNKSMHNSSSEMLHVPQQGGPVYNDPNEYKYQGVQEPQ